MSLYIPNQSTTPSKRVGGGGGLHVFIHGLRATALVGGVRAASRTCRFTLRETALGSRAGLKDVEKETFFILPGRELDSLDAPPQANYCTE
jgi:hypothetical protein